MNTAIIKEQIDDMLASWVVRKAINLIADSDKRGFTRAARRFIEQFYLAHRHSGGMVLAVAASPIWERYSFPYSYCTELYEKLKPQCESMLNRELTMRQHSLDPDNRKLMSDLEVRFVHMDDPHGQMATSLAIQFDTDLDKLGKQDLIKIIGAMGVAAGLIEYVAGEHMDALRTGSQIVIDELLDPLKSGSMFWVPFMH